MKMSCKKALALIISLCLVFSVSGMFPVYAKTNDVPSVSNAYAGEYTGMGFGSSKWASVSNSYIYESGANIVRVYFTDGKLAIVTTDKSGNIISSAVKNAELPLFGGFFAGEKYNYAVFGQENLSESNDALVVRVVKYSKNWDRLAACDIYGSNTRVPFDGGCLRMDEYDGHLYIHTSHLMYEDCDGVNHQANMSFMINEETMKLEDSATDIWNVSTGYVSHSFNQFIKTDGKNIYRVDHGDANPRAVVLTKGSIDNVSGYVSYIDLVDIDGNHGDNETGVSVGGMELTENGVITAYTKTERNESGAFLSYNGNIYLAIADKGLNHVTTVEITDYNKNTGIAAYTPRLVKFSDTLFALLWTERQLDADGVETAYVFIDNNGSIIGDVERSSHLILSDCQPVVMSDGSAVWFAGSGSSGSNYGINPACSLKSLKTGVYMHENVKFIDIAPTCVEPGYGGVRICSDCGAYLSEEDYIAPLGHEFKNGLCTRCSAESPAAVLSASIDKENNLLTLTIGAKHAQYASSVVTGFCIPNGLEIVGFNMYDDDCVGDIVYVNYGSYLEFRCSTYSKFTSQFNFAVLQFNIVSEQDKYEFKTNSDMTPYWKENGDANVFVAADYTYREGDENGNSGNNNGGNPGDNHGNNSGGNTGGEVTECSHEHTNIISPKQPTCTEDGYTLSVVCSDCGEILTPAETIKAAGHKYKNGVCTVCGEKDPLYIPITPGEKKLTLKNEDICSIDYDKKLIIIKAPSSAGVKASVFAAQFETKINFEDENMLISTGSSLTYGDDTYTIIVMGDVNFDGKISASDARTVLRIAARLESADDTTKLAADIDSNGKVSVGEARRVLRFAARLSSEL